MVGKHVKILTHVFPCKSNLERYFPKPRDEIIMRPPTSPFKKGIGIGDSDWIAIYCMLPSPSCIQELISQEIRNGVKTGQESRLENHMIQGT